MITIILGRAAQFLLSLAMMRVATTLLSPAEMGQVSLVLTTAAFFALFLVNPVGMFINRRLHAWQENGVARHYLIRYAGYLALVALFAAAVLPVFDMTGAVDFGMPMCWLMLLVCGSLLFNTINQTSIPSLNLLGDSRSFVALSVATIAASFACATALVLNVELSAQYWLLGLLTGQTLLAAVGTLVLFARLGKAATPEAIGRRHLRTLFSFAWPVAIAAGLSWVQGQGYRYLLEGQLGLAQLGLFVAGYGISAGIIAGFESVLTAYFQPRLYRDVNNADEAGQALAWQRYAAAVIPSLLLTVALIAALAPELTRIFLGKNFQSAADFVVWGALAEAARVLAGVYSLIAHVRMRTHWLILPNALGALAAVGLCMWLIPRLGSAGAGIALAAAGFSAVLAMHVMLVRHVGGLQALPVLFAVIASALLWCAALGLRGLLGAAEGWWFIGIPASAGMIYLALQYLLLRPHLTDKRKA